MTLLYVLAVALVSTGAVFLLLRWLEATGVMTPLDFDDRPRPRH